MEKTTTLSPCPKQEKSVADFQRPQALEQIPMHFSPGSAGGKILLSRKCKTPDAIGIRGFARSRLHLSIFGAQRSGSKNS